MIDRIDKLGFIIKVSRDIKKLFIELLNWWWLLKNWYNIWLRMKQTILCVKNLENMLE